MNPIPTQAVKWPAHDPRWGLRALHYSMGTPFPRRIPMRRAPGPWLIGLYLAAGSGVGILAVKLVAIAVFGS
jgi:hypothetical protein